MPEEYGQVAYTFRYTIVAHANEYHLFDRAAPGSGFAVRYTYDDLAVLCERNGIDQDALVFQDRVSPYQL
jgi:hypothetical protein